MNEQLRKAEAHTNAASAPSNRTLLLLCPTCAHDSGEPLGVAGAFGDSPDDAVMIRCDSCSTVYFSPLRSVAVSQPPSIEISLRRRFRRWVGDLKADARILCVYPQGMGSACIDVLGGEVPAGRGVEWHQLRLSGADPSEHSSERHCSEAGRYDLILIVLALECDERPGALLSRLASLLNESAQVIVVALNTGSGAFSAFGGRHWNGYRLAGARQYFNEKALRALCGSAGLEVLDVRSLYASGVWRRSLQDWLKDWDIRQSLARIAAGDWIVARIVARGLEAFFVLRGRGSLLSARLQKVRS